MTNLGGVRKLLTELAIICTEKQFANLCATDTSYLEKEYVYLLSTQVRGELCGGVITGALPSNSIAIIPKNCSATYLTFLLTTFPCQYILFEEKINVKAKVKITKKSVSKLVVFKVDEASEDAYGLAEELKAEMFLLYLKNKEDLKYHHLYNIVADLCNILALELYTYPMFKNMDIFILENWKSLIMEYERLNDIQVLYDGLIKSDSTLRNQIMKIHFFESKFDKHIKEQIDGLEN